MVVIRSIALLLLLLLILLVAAAEARSRLDSAGSGLNFDSAASRVVQSDRTVGEEEQEQDEISLRKNLEDAPSAYEELEEFGFPLGLLPHTVVDYSQSEISGRVSYRSIKSLKGVSVRAFFIDWSITGIRVSHNDLVFEVGIASAKFPISNFDESPECEDDDAQISSS